MAEYDTRPTIETVLETMKQGFADLGSRLDRVEAEMKLMREDLRQIARIVINQNERWDRLEDRVDRLERK